MWQYILKRLLLMIPTLLGVALVVFVLMHVVPGDIALLILGAGEQGGDVNLIELEKVRQKLGLDRPLYQQFFSWVWGIVRLDFGNSLWTGAPVIEELRIRFPLTLEIALLILGAGEQGGDVNLTELDKVRQKLGLDRPLYVQFFSWVWGIVRLDFGNSLWTGAPVIEELRIRFPLTLEIAVFATLVSTVIAIPLGTLAAIRQDTWVDYGVRVISIGGLAIPNFWTGILLILFLIIYFQ